MLRQLIIARRRLDSDVGNYLYDPVVAATPRVIDGLGTHDKILYWDKALKAAATYWMNELATYLLKTDRFGFDGLHKLMAFKKNARADIEITSEKDKTQALTVARFLDLQKHPYMRKLKASQVTTTENRNTPGDSESTKSKRAADDKLDDNDGTATKKSKNSKASTGNARKRAAFEDDGGDNVK